MNKTIVINAGSGDLNSGFNQVTVQIRAAYNTIVQQFIGSLPADANLIELYKNWQKYYIFLCDRQLLRSFSVLDDDDDDPLEINASGTTNISEVDFNDLCQELQESMNAWLSSKEFLNVSQQLRSHLNPEDEIRVIIETEDELVRRLPWHRCNLFQDYHYAEMALFRPEYQIPSPPQAQNSQNKVRILAILGNSQGINLEEEKSFLTNLQDAEVEFLVKPSRQEFDKQLWNSQGWDILFFAGHSTSEGSTGKMYINENQTNNSLTIEQLEEALTAAIKNGLQLAIFNSCDGLGLAQQLEKLNIPTIIAMREPIPNRVAQEFFKHFIGSFAKNQKSLYLSVKEARGKLRGLEDEYPVASWLPMIFQNPAVKPLTWVQLGGGLCPYRGLYAFAEQDAELFFGREKFTQNLVATVRKKSLVAVVGASGSGKSSVVFAGLVPQLNQDTLANWQIISFRPGNNPIEALARAFTLLLPLENENAQGLLELELQVALEQDPQALYQIIEKYVQQNPGTRLVLIADQFEELYTLAPESQHHRFLDVLLTACNHAPAFTLVITLRADFYGYALSYRPFSDALEGTVLNLGSMSSEELHSAVAKPAAQVQLGLEDGLTDKIVDDIGCEPGRLPLLEFALAQLWEQRENGWLTHQAYNKIGGVSLALGEYAEQVYAQLSEDDRKKAQQMFIQLVRLGEGAEATRRLSTRSQIQNWDLVTHLASQRLVVTNRNFEHGEETVEIVHEVLIKSWGRLEQWLQDNQDFLRWRNRLEDAMGEWENHGNHEDYLLRKAPLVEAEGWWQKRAEEISSSQGNFIEKSLELASAEKKKEKRRRQFTIYGLSVGFILALSLAGIAELNSRKANISETKAIARYSQALFTSNNRLDALIEALKANQKIQKGITPTETQAQVELALKRAIYGADEYNRFLGHKLSINAVEFSPNGEIIASASDDETIKLWNKQGKLLRTLNSHNDQVWGLAFSSNGELIASASRDTTVKLWNKDGKLLSTFKDHNNAVTAVEFSPNDELIASASRDNTVKIWNQNGKLLKILKDHNDAVNAVQFSPNGQIIASASKDKTIKLWNKDGKLLNTLKGHNDAVTALEFSPDGQIIASASRDKNIKLWKADGTEITTLKGHENKVYAITFSPDGKMIASASYDNTVRLWKHDDNSWELWKTLKGHKNIVWGVSFSPDGKTIASASRDKTVRLWKVNNPILKTVNGHKNEVVWAVSYSPNGEMIASASADQTVKLWSRDGTFLKTLKDHKKTVQAVAFSPNSEMIASASDDGIVKLWNRDGTLFKNLKDHQKEVKTVAFSPNGEIIATGSSDQTVKLWNKDGKLLKTLKDHKDTVRRVAFSPNDDIIIASASNDQTVKLWNKEGKLLQTLKGHEGRVYGIDFSPDGNIIASASNDKTVKLWKREGNLWKLWKTLEGHDSTVTTVAFSPNGEIIASGSLDKTVKLWNKDGSKINTLNGHEGAVYGIAFSFNNQTIVSASEDGKLIMWDLDQEGNMNRIMDYSCNWVHDYLKNNYLKNNSSLEKSDRHLCK